MPFNSIVPGENDWMNRVLDWRTPQPAKDSWSEKLMQRLNSPAAQIGLRILANNRGGQSFGGNLGQSVLGYQQDQAQSGQADLQRKLLEAQIAKLNQPQQLSAADQEGYGQPQVVIGPDGKPQLVQFGNRGTQRPVEGLQPAPEGRPSSIQEYEYLMSLPEKEREAYLNVKRQPAAPQITLVNGVPTLVNRVAGTTNPLSTVEGEAAAAGQIAQGRATGQARGEAEGSLAKKGINALTILDQLDIADPLIDAATGSLAGAAVDKLASVYGEAPKGAQAIAQLKVLQAGLMLNMPRMEGPQSDRDVQLYREAAGQLGEPTVPRDIKKAAVQTIRRLQEQYAAGAKQPASGPSVGEVRKGYRFKGGDPSQQSSWEKVP